MVKILGNGLIFMQRFLSKENLRIAEKFITRAEEIGNDILEKAEELNATISENTDKLCAVLEIDLLDMSSFKEVIDNHGSVDFHSVVLLKGEFDKKNDKRVYFVQKLDSNKKPVIDGEILCLYVNNVDLGIQQWFGDKEMVLINK